MTSDLPSSLARPASENEAENRALRNRTRPLGILNRLKREWAHQKIAQEPDRLAAIVESSDDAIISKDLNGIIKTWNAGAELIFGFTAAEAIGQPITILIPPERQHEDRGILDRIRQGERIYHYETVRRRKDGTLLDISLTVSPLKNSEGRIVGISKIARDITERKKSESALRE